MKTKVILFLSLLFGCSSYAQSGKTDSKLFLVTFESNDIGDVRFYLELSLKEGKVIGGSLQNAYAQTFDGADRTKIKLFAGIKNKRLVYVEGYYKEENGALNFHTAFFSPIRNYYFNGTIQNNTIEGELATPDSSTKARLWGKAYEKESPEPVTDYQQLSASFCSSFEASFFDPAFLKTSKYQNLKENLTGYSSKAQDDLHYVFSVYYYTRSLPYSHIGIWRKEKDKKEIKEEDELSYTKKGNTGVLTIRSFTTEPGEMARQMDQLLNDDIQNLVIDLRNNPGGNIGPAIELGQSLVNKPTSGGYFLSRKYYEAGNNTQPDACTVFSQGNMEQFVTALGENKCVEVKITPGAHTFKKPIYILTNEGTASTCEPIVYALKQEPHITIAGQHTAGKMLSAKEVPLADGFVLFVPDADYVTTARERLDQKGVEPEVSLKQSEDALEYALQHIGR